MSRREKQVILFHANLNDKASEVPFIEKLNNGMLIVWFLEPLLKFLLQYMLNATYRNLDSDFQNSLTDWN